jgi:hypothetical protein
MRRRYFGLAAIVAVLLAVAMLTATPGPDAMPALAQVPTPTPTSCPACVITDRTCPGVADYCILGNCSHVFTLSCPSLANTPNFYVHIWNVEYCDDCVDVWGMSARFYGAHGYIGGGALSPASGGSYYCLDEKPTSVVIVWDGDYNCNYYTKGVTSFDITVCSGSDCNP